MARTDVEGAGPDAAGPARVTVDDIGGIGHYEGTIRPGVTVLVGENATNRTSLLTAIAGALGGDLATLKSDADAGEVELRVGGETYRRTYAREGGTVTASGTPLCDDGDVVDLFVALVEGNEARRAVERGDDLRDVIMRPVDTEEIRRAVRERTREREEVEAELERVERERSRLPDLDERRREIEAEREAVTADLESVREAVEARGASEADARRAESLLDELDELRRERDRLAEEMETQRTSVAALREERAELESDLDGLTVDDGELDELDREVDRLRDRKRELADRIGDLSAIVDLNDDLVNSNVTALPGVGTDDGDPVSALDPSSREIECWTCGSRVPRGAVAGQLDTLREVVAEQREARREVVEELDAAEERRATVRAAADERDELEARLDDISERIDEREERIESLRADRDEIRGEIDRLEARLDEEEFEDAELADRHRRLSELEYERGQLDQRLADVEREIEEVEDLAGTRAELETRREELDEEIAALRSRIEDLERSAVEQFNDRMSDVLDVLGYENVERVWIERKGASGRRDGTTFDLHVVRESAAGAVYEDSVDTLSESEREVVGLVVALAGYLVHEVSERVPFMLLDSLEAIDADRIASLLDYFADHVPYLVVALLPGDAAALDVEHERVPADPLGA